MQMYRPERVWHVGSLDPADRQFRPGDLEGRALSVSEHPDAWRQIARLSGDLHEGVKQSGDAAFLDALSLADWDYLTVSQWGEAAGLVAEPMHNLFGEIVGKHPDPDAVAEVLTDFLQRLRELIDPTLADRR